MLSFKLFFEATLKNTTSWLTPLMKFVNDFGLPYAIVLEGATSPHLQVLIGTLSNDGKPMYKIAYERNQINPDGPNLYKAPPGRYQHNLQDFAKIGMKTNDPRGPNYSYTGYGLTKQQLKKFLSMEGINEGSIRDM